MANFLFLDQRTHLCVLLISGPTFRASHWGSLRYRALVSDEVSYFHPSLDGLWLFSLDSVKFLEPNQGLITLPPTSDFEALRSIGS